MELWVAFGFGAGVGGLVGFLLGRHRRPPPGQPAILPSGRSAGLEIRRIALDEGSANVLNALNNRLAAIGALADLLQGSQLDTERARALMMLHGEVRRAAEITTHFLELADHPVGVAEPCDVGVVVSGVLGERETTCREHAVRVFKNVPVDLPMVACPMVQLTDMLTKLVDFSLRRLREVPSGRELRLDATPAGPSIVISLWDSGVPLPVEAEQRLVSPFRFTHASGGGEVEFALARAIAQSSGGSVRLRPRGGRQGAEIVVTLPKSVLGPLARATMTAPHLPKLRLLVVDDDVVNRQAMVMLLEREGHDVLGVENGVDAMERLGDGDSAFDAVVTDLHMPRLGGRALFEQIVEERPGLARRFVFVTGDQAREETRRFLENCGQPSVTKPYELGDLLVAIGTAVRPRT